MLMIILYFSVQDDHDHISIYLIPLRISNSKNGCRGRALRLLTLQPTRNFVTFELGPKILNQHSKTIKFSIVLVTIIMTKKVHFDFCHSHLVPMKSVSQFACRLIPLYTSRRFILNFKVLKAIEESSLLLHLN